MEFYKKRILLFKPSLLKAFFKMILGINVQITQECRKDWGKESLGQWFYITSMNGNETVNICSQKHMIFENVSLKDLVL